MAENIPNPPGGALPPKPSDSKVLPKKETVRINLPPKPSAAPTIKLPTLPPGGPSAAAAAPAQQRAAAAPATSAPRATAAPATVAPGQQRPAAGPAQRPAPRPAAAVSGFDKILAIAAAVAALAAVGMTVWLAYFFEYGS